MSCNIVARSLKRPILYGKEISPACRAVLLTAKALGIDLDLKIIDLAKKEHLDPSYLKLNPTHTIPTLDDNGFVIWDSHVITTYLINKYSKNDLLYPKDPRRRAVTDLRLHFDNGTAMPSLVNIAKPLKQKLFKIIPKDKMESVVETYRLLDLFLANSDFVGGKDLTVADFHLITTVTSLNCFVSVNEEYQYLNKWIEKCKGYAWYGANVEGLNDFRVLFHGLMYA